MNKAAPPIRFASRRQLFLTGGGILVVAGMAAAGLWAYQWMMENTGHPTGQRDCYELAAAVEQFANEYDQWPLASPAIGDAETDTSSSSGLLPILKGTDSRRNPQRLDFLGDLKAASFRDGNPKGGLQEEGEELSFYDAGGLPLRLRMDTDGDGKITNPNPAGPAASIRKTVIVWGAGKDGNFETWKDNVCNWAETQN